MKQVLLITLCMVVAILVTSVLMAPSLARKRVQQTIIELESQK